jgi:AraC-like DNA-binding protein
MVSARPGGLLTSTLETDQPNERVELYRPLWLAGATFWNVDSSVRLWSMHHETYAASLVLGPGPELQAAWRSRGAERVATAGSIQLLNPGEAHRTTAVSEPASFFVLWTTVKAMTEAARELEVKGSVWFAMAQLDRSPAEHPLRELQRAVKRGATRLELDHHYLESLRGLLTFAGESRLPSSRPAAHPGVRRSLELLHDELDRSLSLDELAQAANLSKFHFARCFHRTTGITPHRYQQLVRLQQARRLLESGSTVDESAAKCGFADASHLSRDFRRWLGIPPGQWARAARVTVSA